MGKAWPITVRLVYYKIFTADSFSKLRHDRKLFQIKLSFAFTNIIIVWNILIKYQFNAFIYHFPAIFAGIPMVYILLSHETSYRSNYCFPVRRHGWLMWLSPDFLPVFGRLFVNGNYSYTLPVTYAGYYEIFENIHVHW